MRKKEIVYYGTCIHSHDFLVSDKEDLYLRVRVKSAENKNCIMNTMVGIQIPKCCGYGMFIPDPES